MDPKASSNTPPSKQKASRSHKSSQPVQRRATEAGTIVACQTDQPPQQPLVLHHAISSDLYDRANFCRTKRTGYLPMPYHAKKHSYLHFSCWMHRPRLQCMCLIAVQILHLSLLITAASGQNIAKALPKPITPKSNYVKKCNPGGLRSTSGAFRYSTVADGIRAMDRLLKKKYFKNPKYNTIEKYVPRYAGKIGARKIETYKRNISAWSGIPRNKVIAVHDRRMLNALLAAALRQESGGDWRLYIKQLFPEEEVLAQSN